MELQELVSRARILFQGAPKRVRVFELVNGKKSAKEISKHTIRSLSATLQDLQKMRDMDVIVIKEDSEGKTLKKEGSIVYEKHPLLKHLSNTYFEDPTQLPRKRKDKKKVKTRTLSTSIRMPTEQEIMDICRSGEDQIYEFKSSGTDVRSISKEVCALGNTKNGGIIFYGVQDDGTIENADMKRQVFDQKIQNSIRNTVTPTITIKLVEKDVLGHKIFLIGVPPWNKKSVYKYANRVYLRQGTNVFTATTNEIKELHSGRVVI